jgi:hypothetical protein
MSNEGMPSSPIKSYPLSYFFRMLLSVGLDRNLAAKTVPNIPNRLSETEGSGFRSPNPGKRASKILLNEGT